MEFVKKLYEELKETKIFEKMRKLLSAAGRPPRTQPAMQEEPLAFMTCIIKVDTTTRGWQKSVLRIIKSSHGVRNFKMDKQGRVEVSGIVNPKQLVKTLGKGRKRPQLCWLQYGECSRNLFGPPAAAAVANTKKQNDPLEFVYDHRFLPYNGYGSYPYPPQLFMSHCCLI